MLCSRQASSVSIKRLDMSRISSYLSATRDRADAQRKAAIQYFSQPVSPFSTTTTTHPPLSPSSPVDEHPLSLCVVALKSARSSAFLLSLCGHPGPNVIAVQRGTRDSSSSSAACLAGLLRAQIYHSDGPAGSSSRVSISNVHAVPQGR